jgi:curli biogenesis system outer membrane secretion channel CsgG
MKKSLLSTCVMLFLCTTLFSQKKVNVEFEKIKEQCKDVALEKRVKVAVARFSVTAQNTGGVSGDNFATMLTNALQEVNCFRMLEQLKNLSDLTSEVEFNQSENSSGEDGPEKGKMIAANVIVTGELTEFSKKAERINILGVRTTKQYVKLGFIVKLVNPQTREIIFSKSINVEGKTDGGTSAGMSVPFFGRVEAVGGGSSDPAVADAFEKGIIQAVEYLTSQKDKMPMPGAENQGDGIKTTIVTVNNAEFTALTTLTETVRGFAGVKDVQKTLKDGNGVIKIKHTGTSEDLLNLLMKQYGKKLKVSDFSEGKISITISE